MKKLQLQKLMYLNNMNDIIKFQNGGITFVNPIKGGINNKQQVSSKKEDSDDALGDIIDKISGLPSDIVALQESLRNITTDFRGNVSKSSSAYRYIVSKIALAAANKKLAEQAVEFVKANDSMREYAITNNGGIYVYKNTEDGRRRLSLISINDFDNTKHLPAYISDLINERSNNPAYANNNELLTTIGDSIGRSVVFKKIMDIVQNVKYSTNEGSMKVITDGIRKISNENGEGAWAQTKTETVKITQNDNDPNIQRALVYIFNNLTAKEQRLLTLVGKEQNMSIKNIIGNVIKTQSQELNKTDYDFVRLSSGGSGSGSGNGKSGSEKENFAHTTATSQAYMLQHDMGEKINDPIKLGSTVLTTINGGWLSRDIFTKDGNNVIDGGTMRNVLFNSQIAPAIDKNSIYFGGKKVSVNDLDYIAYKSSGYKSLYLPYIKDSQNNITIDFNKWKLIEKAETEIKELGIKDRGSNQDKIDKIASIYKKYGVEDVLDYAYANANVDEDGVTKEQKKNAEARLQKFIFIEGLSTQNSLSKYGSGAINPSPLANVYNLNWTYNKSDSKEKQIQKQLQGYMFKGTDINPEKDSDKLPLNLQNIYDDINSDSDIVESLVYAPVHRDFTSTGIATENMVIKKQFADDQKTNKGYSETDYVLTDFPNE